MERDLTTGSVFKTVIYFSLPYLLSYFLQTLYGMADLFIVGQFGGVSSTTAVSIGSQIMHMLTVMIVGLAMGATVMIGRCIGAKDYKKASETIGNTATMFMGIAIILMIILLAAVRPIVSVMSTPAEAAEGTIRYLTICFIGIPFITAYNIISAIFTDIRFGRTSTVEMIFDRIFGKAAQPIEGDINANVSGGLEPDLSKLSTEDLLVYHGLLEKMNGKK